LWEFEKEDETITISPPAYLASDCLDLEVSAAVQGLGIIRGFEEFVTPGIATGELVAILEDWVSTFPGPFLYYASRRLIPAPLKAFVDFLRAEQRRTSGT
jgi:DNA-binding transcriptional LysR family regulator